MLLPNRQQEYDNITLNRTQLDKREEDQTKGRNPIQRAEQGLREGKNSDQ